MRTASILLTAAVAFLPFVGCSAVPTMSAPDLEWLSKLSGNDEGPPAQLVAMWTDASLRKPGVSGATRGFGGRIYFYDAKQRSVKAEGELVVYAFVEKDRQVPSKLPERKFVFTAEELEQNYAKTALGHCYNVWLPWGKDDEDQAVSVSLLPTLKSPEGKVVMGSQSLNTLKGKENESEGLEAVTVVGSPAVQQVSYDSEDESTAKEGSSRRRMSIYDPQTNVTVGPTELPVGHLPGPSPGVSPTSYESDLPQATGVSTTTFDLPTSMALAIKKAPPRSMAPQSLSDRFEAYQEAERNAKAAGLNGGANGPVFDLAQAAALDRRGAASAPKSQGPMSPESLARFIAANAGAVPSVGDAAAKDSEEKSEKKSLSRFSPSQRRTPAWERNHARWRQEE